MDGSKLPKLSEVGQQLGVTHQRVQQIEEAAIAKNADCGDRMLLIFRHRWPTGTRTKSYRFDAFD